MSLVSKSSLKAFVVLSRSRSKLSVEFNTVIESRSPRLICIILEGLTSLKRAKLSVLGSEPNCYKIKVKGSTLLRDEMDVT